MVVAMLSSACTKDSGPVVIRPPAPDTLSFQDTILPILVAECAHSGCHPGSASLDLTMAQAYSSLVNVQSLNYAPYLRVKKFSPDSSVLYQKVIGNTDFGVQMPIGPNTSPLSDEEKGLIYDWIAQGAMNN